MAMRTGTKGARTVTEHCPPWQDLTTLARNICAGKTTIELWVKQGRFPKPRKQGGKRMWRWEDVDRYLAGGKPQEQDAADLMARIKDGTRKAMGA